MGLLQGLNKNMKCLAMSHSYHSINVDYYC